MDHFKQLITDIKVSLDDAFDRNFEDKAFFGQRWPETQRANHRGSLMQRTGKLRRSITSQLRSYGIRYTSSVPYASLHNEGGEVKVTPRMKKFFWAMYYQAAGAVSYSIKTRKKNNTSRNNRLSEEAEYWKAMALKKTGSKIKVAQRQFIGHAPGVDRIVKKCADRRMNEFADNLHNNFKKLT